MFKISPTPLEEINLKEDLTHSEAGALATFEGWVRNNNNGKKVVSLEYEVFDTLAQKEGEKILEEAKNQFNIQLARCFHRSGKLKVGEMAVWVGVVSGHREEAFKACRYIIDEVKKRLPIWKKEYYEAGDCEWVGIESAPPVSQNVNSESKYYSRQINLPEVGKEGQEKLNKARVLVVGAGGLGNSALLYLASAGIGTIGICEHDHLDMSNLHRQVIYSFDEVGKPKAELAKKRLEALNPFIRINIHNEKLTAENAVLIAKNYDVIVDCTDNFPAKYLLNDLAVLNQIPLVQASVFQLEGQMLFYNPQKKSACLRCLWPQMPDALCVGICTTAGILGVVPGFFGVLQATEVIKFILSLPELLNSEMLIFDLTTYRSKKVVLTKDPSCPICGNNPTINVIESPNYSKQTEIDLDIETLPMNEFKQFALVDIREPMERVIKPVGAIKCIELPLSELSEQNLPFNANKKYLLFCEQGIRSHRLSEILRDRGVPEAFSVINGADAVNAYLSRHLREIKE